MKDFLKKLIKAKEDRAKELRSLIEKATTADEVRSLGEELKGVNSELAEARGQLAKLDEQPEDRSFNPLGTYGAGRKEERQNKGIDSEEYRSAFMRFVTSGVKIPQELREDQVTKTTDISAAIPTVLINRIVEKMQANGMIMPLVTRTAYAAGVVIPTSSVKPVASWVAEGATSAKQKKSTGQVTFSHFKLRCEIAVTAEVDAMALSAFEDTFVKNVSDAMVIAIEKAILGGNGTTQPKGIITEGLPNGSDRIITTTGTDGAWTYADLIAAEAAVPVEYESRAKWFMTKAQFGQILAMSGTDGQPIARVNYGIGGKPERMILGREVVLHSYATEMGSYIAGIYDFGDYVLNTIYDMGIKREQDWDTEDLKTKAVMAVDGKPVSVDSLVLVQAGE